MKDNINKVDKMQKSKKAKKFTIFLKRNWKMMILSLFLAFVLYIALILP